MNGPSGRFRHVRDDVRVRQQRSPLVDDEARALRLAVRAEIRVERHDTGGTPRVDRCRVEAVAELGFDGRCCVHGRARALDDHRRRGIAGEPRQASEGEGTGGAEKSGNDRDDEGRWAHPGHCSRGHRSRPEARISVSTWKRARAQTGTEAVARWVASAAGSSKVKAVAPGLLATVTVPPILPASSRAIVRPSPLPDA